MAAAFQPDDTRAIGAALVSFLAGRLGGGTLVEGPDRITGGRDTYVYGFRMSSASIPDDWLGPLILRVYATDREGPKAEREAAAQRFATERGFCAPRPLMVEVGAVPFGLPFMINGAGLWRSHAGPLQEPARHLADADDPRGNSGRSPFASLPRLAPSLEGIPPTLTPALKSYVDQRLR